VAEVSSQSGILKVLDHLHDDIRGHQVGVALAALIYLRWVDFQDAEQEAIAAFDGAEYRPALSPSMHFRSWHAFPPDELSGVFADRLPQALEGLSNSLYNPLAVNLHRALPAVKYLGRLSPRSLSELVGWLADQPFETLSDRRTLLDVFDAVLSRLPDRFSGEFRTPDVIARLLVEIAAPAAGERVYDPCFGSGGLLTAACDYVLRKEKNQLLRSGAPGLMISGVERNPEAYLIGLTRLALGGIADPQLELGNSLERIPLNNPQRDGFDVVLANPPWGLRVDASGLDHFPVRTTDATGLFIQHALSMLRPQGRAVIVVPQGILFRRGREQRLRRMLLEQHTMDAVVSLPQGVFLPYTGIQGSVLVLRRGGSTNRIRMVDAEPFFEKSRGRQPATIRTELAKQLRSEIRAPEPGKHSWDIGIEDLAEIDWDITPRRIDKSDLVSMLQALRSKTPVSPLRAFCSIYSGQVIKQEHLSNTPPAFLRPPKQPGLFPEEKQRLRQTSMFDGNAIPYIRIRDVQQDQVTKGSLWLTEDGAARLDPKWKLRAGDILLSKSGTIGKAGIVRNGGIGAIAASGFFVLQANQWSLDPHYLLAYLNSAECQAWLDDKARGTSVRHLSRRDIEDLPVPCPPMQIQHRVANQCREHGIDMLGFLSQLLTEGERDPIAEWVEKAVQVLPVAVDSMNDPLDFSILDHLTREVLPIRNETVHGRQPESPLVAWVVQFSDAMTVLHGVRDLPLGPGLLSVLQESARSLKDAVLRIAGQLPIEAKARRLTQLIATWLDVAVSALMNSVRLVLQADVGVLQAGKQVEISLKVHNQGPLPLRDLSITTTPDWGHGKFSYLAENSEASINLAGLTPKAMGAFALRANWAASTLDGQRVNGSRDIALDIIEPTPDLERTGTELGGSPYVTGDPVKPSRDDVFFGREELLAQISRQVVRSGNVVLLEGNRRSGKTSILWHLEGPDAVPGWLGVYCSLQKPKGSDKDTGVPTAEVFRLIAECVSKAIYKGVDKRISLPNGELPPQGPKLNIDDRKRFGTASRESISEESPFSDLCDYIEFVLEELEERHLGLLLMLDEFDKLQEGIDNKVTSPQVPENIRYLVQSYPRISAILTGSRRLKRLREEYWSALFGLGTRFSVTSLPQEPARRLITEPVKGRLAYAGEAVEWAIYLTAGQPYLLQCLCNRVFDIAAQLKIRSVTLDLVDQASKALVEDNEHFANLWDYAASNRRRFILALCHKEATGPDPLRLGVMQERLLGYGIQVNDETLIADLEFLRELELIELVEDVGGGHYALSIPLMGTWVKDQQDFAVVLRKARLETEDHHE
jgi:type I restriction enzyme M protein